MRVLVVEDGLGSYILPAVRSLGAAGATVGLGGPRRSRAASSRWVHRTHPVPPAEDGLPAFTAAVRRAVHEGGYDVVFGGDDVEVLALSAVRDQLDAVVPYAPHDAVVGAIDKLHLVEAAHRIGLAAPRTVAASSAAAAEVHLPVVAKARLHWAPGSAQGRGRHAARICSTAAELDDAVQEIAATHTSAVLQELVAGNLTAVTALCAPGGRVVAESHQVATRISPVLRTSTRAQTVPVDEELSRSVGALLADLGWLGIANLQFLTPRTGRPQLIDLNGRFYGSLVLAVSAGLDLPALWAAIGTGAGTGLDPAAPLRGRPGVRYQALEEDLRRARAERRGGLLADVAGTFGYAATAVHSTWERSDLRPALARAGELATRRVVPGRREQEAPKPAAACTR